MTQFAKKLRGILEKAGKLEAGDGDTLLAEARAQKRPFTEVLVKKGVATEQDLVALIAKAANIPPIDLSKLTLNKENGQFLGVLNQKVLQDIKKSFKDVHLDQT